MKRVTPAQRRAAFGKLIARRVKAGELTRRTAEIIIDDFGAAMSETNRGARSVRRSVKRGYGRAL